MENIGERLVPLDAAQLVFQPNSCDLCGASHAERVHTVRFLNMDFTFVKCLECGLMYQNPLLSPSSREHLYSTIEYWEHTSAERENVRMLNYSSYLADEELRRKNAVLRTRTLAAFLPPPARIMDLCCADGLFVHELSRAGYDAVGIDMSAAMVERGRTAYKVDIRKGDAEESLSAFGSFDAVTCFAAMSNMVRPSLVFKNVASILKPGGHFLFNFGNFDCTLSRLLGRRHYLFRPSVGTIFTKATMLRYCTVHGFHRLEMSKDVQYMSVSRILGFLNLPGIEALLRAFRRDRAHVKINSSISCILHARKRVE